MSPFQPIKTASAPAGLSDVYSQAVRAGNTVYVSGMIPRNLDGVIVQGTVADRARQIIKNIEEVLAAADMTLGNIVKANIYLTNLSQDFAAVNEVWKELMPNPKPARTCIGVKELPSQALGTDVEMEVVAYDDRQ